MTKHILFVYSSLHSDLPILFVTYFLHCETESNNCVSSCFKALREELEKANESLRLSEERISLARINADEETSREKEQQVLGSNTKIMKGQVER